MTPSIEILTNLHATGINYSPRMLRHPLYGDYFIKNVMKELHENWSELDDNDIYVVKQLFRPAIALVSQNLARKVSVRYRFLGYLHLLVHSLRQHHVIYYPIGVFPFFENTHTQCGLL